MNNLYSFCDICLPQEIQKGICDNLNTLDLAFCCQVCVSWRSFIHKRILKEEQLVLISPQARAVKEQKYKHNKNKLPRNFGFVRKEDLCAENIVTNWPRNRGELGISKDIVKYACLEKLADYFSCYKSQHVASLIFIYRPLEDLLDLIYKNILSVVDSDIRDLLQNKDNIRIFKNDDIKTLYAIDESDYLSSLSDYIDELLSDNICSDALFNIMLHIGYITSDDCFWESIHTISKSVVYWEKLLDYMTAKQGLTKDYLFNKTPFYEEDHVEECMWLISKGFIFSKLDLEIFMEKKVKISFIELIFQKLVIEKAIISDQEFIDLCFMANANSFDSLNITEEFYQKNKQYIENQ